MKDNEILKNKSMSEEELDQVTGGIYEQNKRDRAFFNALGFNLNNTDDVTNSFKKYGIDYNTAVYSDNEYVFQGAYSYAKHPRVAALGYVLDKMKYPGYSGEWWNLDYTKQFIKDHIGSNVL